MRLLLLILLLLPIGACGRPEAEAMLERYAFGVADALGAEIPLDLRGAALAAPPFPPRRSRLLPTEDLREGVIEVWDFRRCGMMDLIAARNSVLGRVMPPSQRMSYEIRFLQALEECLDRLRAAPQPHAELRSFLERLEQIHRSKRRDLPAVIWNAIYGAEEIGDHFSVGRPPLPLRTTGFDDVFASLERLHDVAALPEAGRIVAPAWLDRIEDDYRALHHSAFGARLLTSLRALARTLDRTAGAIEERLESGSPCRPHGREGGSERRFDLLRRSYLDQVQPYLALVRRQGRAWLELHDRLLRTLPATEAMRRYHRQVVALDAARGPWRSLEAARLRHRAAWQELLQSCRPSPAPDPGRAPRPEPQ